MNDNAFSLAEIVIVVIIMSVIAMFAIPNYFRGLEKQKERTAAVNLIQLVAGAQAWRAATSSGTLNMNGINALNNVLRTDVMLDADQTVTTSIDQATVSIAISWNGKTIVFGNTMPTPCCGQGTCLTDIDEC